MGDPEDRYVATVTIVVKKVRPIQTPQGHGVVQVGTISGQWEQSGASEKGAFENACGEGFTEFIARLQQVQLVKPGSLQ